MLLSTTSSQTCDTEAVSKSNATERPCRISQASWSTSVQRSLSSPERHALFRKAKANERAARAPTRARPAVARLLEASAELHGVGHVKNVIGTCT